MQLHGVLAVCGSFVNLVFISRVTKIRAPPIRSEHLVNRKTKLEHTPPLDFIPPATYIGEPSLRRLLNEKEGLDVIKPSVI